MATYLYGIVRAQERKQSWGSGVGPPPAKLRLVTHGSVAALVSDVGGEESESEGRALRRDLRAHEAAVRRAMEIGTILPVSFGTIFDDDDQLIDELLEPTGDQLEELLDEFDGLVELTLKADFIEDMAIRRLLERDGELRAWRDSASFSGTDDQVAFGQALAEAIEDEAAQYGERLLDRLAPLAQDVLAGNAGPGTAVLKASFLVADRRLPKFDAAVEELADQLKGFIEFDYVGPLPPYSFVNFNLRAHAPQDS